MVRLRLASVAVNTAGILPSSMSGNCEKVRQGYILTEGQGICVYLKHLFH